MSAPPTTRASRSRYASPAVGGGTRNTKDCNSKEGDKGAAKDKDRRGKDNGARPARSSSMERSRRFMESWIEPERAKMTSFQEDGLVRQGVLETMEPLGTRPKPAMIKKLVGIGREASPTPSARGKLAGRKIVVKRKTGNGAVSSGRTTPGAAAPAAPEPLSGTQSPTPAPSTTVATPQTATSPTITPIMANIPRASPPQIADPLPSSELAPEWKLSAKSHSRHHPPESPSATLLPASSIPSLPPAALSTSLLTDPFLPDPVKQSIEEPQSLHNLPTTPRSIASTYDTDEYCRRESSLQSLSQINMPSKRTVDKNAAEQSRSTPGLVADTAETVSQQPQRRTGPVYIASELARIVEHKEVVKTAIEKGVEEALRHFRYVDAWALQFMYDDKEEDARFLLLTEAVFIQTATPQAVGEWARELHAFKVLGMKSNTALRYFVPEARTDKSYNPPEALQAEHDDLITMDMSVVRDPNNYKLEPQLEMNKAEESGATGQQPEGGVSQAEAQEGAEAETEAEAERERVATPPRKRQKTSSRDSPVVRKASSSARASAMKGHGNVSHGGYTAESPLRQRHRSLSEDSDLSTLSSLGSLSPPSPDPASWARPVDKASQDAFSTSTSAAVDMNDDVQMHGHSGSAEGMAGATVTDGTSEAAPDEAAALAQPIAGGRRRAPARARRSGPNNLAPEPGPVARLSPGGPNLTSKAKAKRNSNLDSRNPTPDSHSPQSANDDFSASANITINPSSSTTQPTNQSFKRSKRGMPNFDPQYRLEDGDEATVRRRMARNTTLRLTEENRIKGDSFARSRSAIDVPSPPERPASSQSSLSSLSALDDGGFEEPTPNVVVPIARVAPSSARATRSAKRNHDDVDDDATPFSLDFPVEVGLSIAATASRAGTPRPNKKQRTGGRRLKLSPTKNKAAPSAGVPRSGNRGSPSANGALANQEENDDFCSSCGGNGSLVCCDGCTRAFHELCHDPIVDPNDDSEWFCHDCTIKRDPSKIGEHGGPFGELLTSLDKKGATSYRLPKKIRDYFEGVRTGVDGEYEDYVPPVKGKKKKEEPKPQEEDLYAIVDKENRPIFCHSCQRSAASNRPMMPCSICGLYWHMDCLDPPRPHLPNPRTFVCPCHIDDLLLNVPAQMGPAHKFRKIKGSSEIVYAYRRGNTNNGWIEIEDDESEGDAPLNFRDPGSYGRTYKVRSSGLKEDFISKFTIGKRTRKPASRDRSQLPALFYRDDAEEIYEAARSMIALRRNGVELGVQNSVNAVSDAKSAAAKGDELQAMRAEVARLNAKIAHLQEARGRHSTHEHSLGNYQGSSVIPRADGNTLEDTQPTAHNGVELPVESVFKEIDAASLAGGLKESSGTQPAAETLAKLSSSVVKAEPSPEPHMALDSALTPVSDLMKDGDVPLPPTISGAKPNSKGIETPETNVPDQTTSLADAGDMALD